MNVLLKTLFFLFLLSPPISSAEDVVKRSALTILVDKSGSMKNDDRIHFTKVGINTFIEEMTEEEYISIIAFDDAPFIFQMPELVTSNIKKVVRKRLNTALHPSGKTNLPAALHVAINNFKKLKNTNNRIVIITDGIVSKYAEKDLIEVLRTKDIPISILHISNEKKVESFKRFLQKKDAIHIVPKETIGKHLLKELNLLRRK